MDWFLQRSASAPASRLRREIRGYLERHGAGDRYDLEAAELVIAELLANACQHGAGPIRVTLDWTGERPLLAVHDLGPPFEIDTTTAPDRLAQHGRGLWLVSQLTTELSTATRAGGKVVSARLPVGRKLRSSTDPLRHGINPARDQPGWIRKISPVNYR